MGSDKRADEKAARGLPSTGKWRAGQRGSVNAGLDAKNSSNSALIISRAPSASCARAGWGDDKDRREASPVHYVRLSSMTRKVMLSPDTWSIDIFRFRNVMVGALRG